MTDSEQLKKLLDVLNLDGTQHVLDVGCGSGRVTEYLSDLTQATFTGLDLASQAINRANERVKTKSHRLKFDHGDLNDPDYLPSTFDAIISIDTLYFVLSQEKAIANWKKILKPGGQLAIFYSQFNRSIDDPEDLLTPDGTTLAQILQKFHIKYKTWDFTDNLNRFWTLSKTLLEDLHPEFVNEGNEFIYQSWYSQAQEFGRLSNEKLTTRFLYHAIL